MKRVIAGKLYNTLTAICVAKSSYNGSCNDFEWFEEELYRTKSGAYFLCGEGGPMSSWAVPVGNNGTGGGSGIMPLSNAEALEWCENNDVDADVITKHFAIKEA